MVVWSGCMLLVMYMKDTLYYAASSISLELNALEVAADEERQHHPGAIGRRAPVAVRVQERVQVKPVNRCDHESGQVPLRHELVRGCGEQGTVAPVAVFGYFKSAAIISIYHKLHYTI
jgi:hypothetical protein